MEMKRERRGVSVLDGLIRSIFRSIRKQQRPGLQEGHTRSFLEKKIQTHSRVGGGKVFLRNMRSTCRERST